MRYTEWTDMTSVYKDVQEKVNNRVGGLIDTYFKSADDYVVEKFIKTFCENIYNLERLLLLKSGLHPSQINKAVNVNILDHQKKSEEIRKRVSAEVERQYRHYNIFLKYTHSIQKNKKVQL